MKMKATVPKCGEILNMRHGHMMWHVGHLVAQCGIIHGYEFRSRRSPSFSSEPLMLCEENGGSCVKFYIERP